MILSTMPFPVEMPRHKAADFRISAGEEGGALQLDTLIIGAVDEQPNLGGPSIGEPTEAQSKGEEVKRLLNLAYSAHNAGDLKQLRSHLNRILEIDPDHAQAHFNLGVLDRDRGAYPEAETHFRRAVKLSPRNTHYHLAVGELMHVMRHLLFAAEAYETGLAIDPNNTLMLTNLTEIRQRQRMPREVAELSRRSLALDPQSASATESLAWALLWLGDTEEAVEAAERALSLDPKSIPAVVMLQIALSRLGQKGKAAAILADIERRSLILWDDCAVVVDRYTQFDERETAERILRNVIDKRPNFVPALLQLGRYMILKSDLDEGFRLMSKVVELNPEEGDAQTSVALTMIRNGEFESGWARHHWRWKRTGCEPRWDLALPEWDGRDLGDGGIIVWREQGIGDMIMYAAPAIACRPLAKKVAIETNPRLQPLLQRSFPDMSIVCREGLPANFLAENNIVAQCPIGDLPHVLKLDMANYPGRNGFLVPDPSEIARLRDHYQLLFPGKRLVGISWRSGNASSAVMRSIELPLWMPVFETEGCAFISLQYGDIGKEVEGLAREHGVDVYIDSDINAMTDMDKFAAQIAAMDVVISVDNSTVHVAGALGKTTWALIPAAADWRWLTPDRTDTVWYRSVTLLRQSPDTDWRPQIENAADRLSRLTTEAATSERIDFYLRCAKQSIESGNTNVGERFYRQVLLLHPDHHAALAGLGQVALQTGYIADAISLLRRAVEAVPEQIDYQASLIEALSAAGRFDQAYGVLRDAMKVDGQNIRVLTSGIRILSSLGKEEEAANYCARLLRLVPDNREARLHLARMQIAAGDFDVAETNLQRLLASNPGDAVAAFTLGCLAFRNEKLAEGWRGYARRFDAGAPNPAAPLDLPVLTEAGPSIGLSQERIAVRPEAGLKDQILFSRWLGQLRRDSNFIAAELDPRLIPLIDQTTTRLSLFPTGSLQTEEADDLRLTSQIALGDLGARYGLELTSLGSAVPYLQFDRTKAAAMRQDYLAALKTKRLIGLCWRGGDFAVPLSEWLPVLGSSDFGFVSLQAGPAQQEMHQVFDGIGKMAIRDPSIDPQTNLRGFAAQIAAVDLVISIDEVPAHLAGALGVPVFCLLPPVADWRWFGQGRSDSPWYPTMRLYRQATDGNWADIMARISSDLISLVGADGAEKKDE
ncbi:MAG TPA: tetratricopeptide repeat protein [Dongiaceae bacterium]|nr:tetratricopeptide repeat protein [Dongiaceae bacterium]